MRRGAIAHLAVLAVVAPSFAFGDEPVGSATIDGALLSPAAVVPGGYVAPDGSIQRGFAIVLSDGKIKDIVASEKFTQIEGVVRWPDAVLSPGLIDLRSAIGAYGQAKESAIPIDPSASSVDSLDPRHRDFTRALSAGITTVMLAPEPNNLISGTAVVVKTAARGAGMMLREEGPLMLALGPTTWEYDREPTSRIGGLAMLRQSLSEAKVGTGHPRLQAFVNGKLDGFIYCGEPMDVTAALRTLSEYPSRFNIIHNSDEDKLSSELVSANVGIVSGPYGFDTPRRTSATAGRLAAAGVQVAFAAHMPASSGAALRTTAALAVRHGMDASKARQAMTTVPAAMAGVQDRVGALRTGLDADLVVFSGDPLRLDSRVLEVYVDGVRVFRSETGL